MEEAGRWEHAFEGETWSLVPLFPSASSLPRSEQPLPHDPVAIGPESTEQGGWTSISDYAISICMIFGNH